MKYCTFSTVNSSACWVITATVGCAGTEGVGVGVGVGAGVGKCGTHRLTF